LLERRHHETRSLETGGAFESNCDWTTERGSLGSAFSDLDSDALRCRRAVYGGLRRRKLTCRTVNRYVVVCTKQYAQYTQYAAAAFGTDHRKRN
jgi:hypothetical protein